MPADSACELEGQAIRMGERVKVDDCRICFCRGSEALCDIRSCPTLSCENPVKIEGECCETCTYYMNNLLISDLTNVYSPFIYG